MRRNVKCLCKLILNAISNDFRIYFCWKNALTEICPKVCLNWFPGWMLLVQLLRIGELNNINADQLRKKIYLLVI